MLEGWAKASIGEIGTVVTGTTPATSSKKFYGGDIPFVAPGDLGNGLWVTTAEKTLTEEGFRAAKQLPKGAVLFTCIGATIGKAGVAARDLATNQQINAVICDPKRADNLFVYYLLALRAESIKRLAGAQAVPIVNKSTFEDVTAPLPPLPEQRKIAEILRTWDEALEKLTALRAAKEHQYRAFAREFFDPCHPSFHGRPNSWQEFELGDVFTERSQPGEDGERLLSVTMNGGVIDRDDVGRKDTSTEDKSRYKLVLPGDIAYNTMRMWQGVSGLSTMRGIVSPAYTIVTPRQRHILGGYAAHLFKSRRMVFDFERYSQGLTSDTWNLKFPAFSKIKLWLPPTDEQEKQANLLDAMLSEQDVLRRQIEALTRQKRGLMQKLLTGEWRVSQ